MVFTSRLFKRRLSRKARKARKAKRNTRKQRGGNVLDGKLGPKSLNYGQYGTETGPMDVDL
jgi:hypothetical protein